MSYTNTVKKYTSSSVQHWSAIGHTITADQSIVPTKNNSGPVYNALVTYDLLHKVQELLMTTSQGMSIVKWIFFVNKRVIEEITMTWNT